MNRIESNIDEKCGGIPEEVFGQIVTGSIVFKTTFRKYLEFIDNARLEVEVLYQKKTFDKNKKLLVTEVNGQ